VSVEVLYSLPVAAEMIPFSSLAALHIWLSAHKVDYPARYRRLGNREIRLLSESEVLRIREEVVSNVSRRVKNGGRIGRPVGSKNGGSRAKMAHLAHPVRAVFRVI
jgi:hypothetical protein